VKGFDVALDVEREERHDAALWCHGRRLAWQRRSAVEHILVEPRTQLRHHRIEG
jgi:hypothetical protein